MSVVNFSILSAHTTGIATAVLQADRALSRDVWVSLPQTSFSSLQQTSCVSACLPQTSCAPSINRRSNPTDPSALQRRADTTAFDNLRGPGHAGEFETILRNNKKNFASGHSVHTPTSEVVITNRDHRPDVGYGTIKSLDTGIF